VISSTFPPIYYNPDSLAFLAKGDRYYRLFAKMDDILAISSAHYYKEV